MGHLLATAGIGPNAHPLDMIDALQRMMSIHPSVWFAVLDKCFGWSLAEVDENVKRDGK